jgi:hypothetical protein
MAISFGSVHEPQLRLRPSARGHGRLVLWRQQLWGMEVGRVPTVDPWETYAPLALHSFCDLMDPPSIAGSGKSVLWFVVSFNSRMSSILCPPRSSAIINDIQVLQAAELASMAYFYFDFRDVRKQSRGDLLRSLLIQLSAASDSFCDILSQLYDEYGNGTRQPSDNSLMRCLTDMLALPNQRPVYLIMDALDECPSTSGIPSAREQVLSVIKDLVDLRLSSLRLCVTSRLEVNIRNALEGLACLSVSLHEERGQKNDIAEYIKSVVHSPSDTLMKRWREDDKDLVIQTLSERADGM